MKRVAIDVIEAAYRSAGTTADWLRAICEAMPTRRHGLGHISTTYQIDDRGKLVIGDVVQIETPGDIEPAMRADLPSLPPEYVRETWAAIPAGTALEAGGAVTRARTRVSLGKFLAEFGIRDIFIINAIDPTDRGAYFGALLGAEMKVARRERAMWNRIAAHLAASHRLRRLANVEPEAIITPNGRIEHAVEDAKTASAQQALRNAALAIDRARMRNTRLDEADAVAMWHALVSGRWTLVDQVDRDGRRYFVARKNDPDVARHHALTRRERQVVGFAALGHSNKLIAYELGLSVSSVAVYLEIAMEKLGVSTRAQLIIAARAFGAASR